MSNKTRIELSVGMVVLVLVGIFLKSYSEHYLAKQRDEATFQRAHELNLPLVVHSQGGTSDVKALPEPLPTNYDAQKAVKYQCPPGGCAPLRPGQRLPDGSIVVSVNDRPNAIPIVPEPVKPVPHVPALADTRERPEAKKYQILLFLDGSEKSAELMQWFGMKGQGDEKLMQLKAVSNFQMYTASNTLYRERYANIVPPEQFPTVLFLDKDGGHIHACGKVTIPDTAADLWDDIRSCYDLYKQAKQGTQVIEASNSGVIKTEGYNFADFVSPTLRLENNEEDCPDGVCPVDPPGWRPGDKVRDGLDKLFDRKKPDSLEGIFISWVSGPERIATLLTYTLIALIALVAYLKFRKA